VRGGGALPLPLRCLPLGGRPGGGVRVGPLLPPVLVGRPETKQEPDKNLSKHYFAFYFIFLIMQENTTETVYGFYVYFPH